MVEGLTRPFCAFFASGRAPGKGNGGVRRWRPQIRLQGVAEGRSPFCSRRSCYEAPRLEGIGRAMSSKLALGRVRSFRSKAQT